MKIPRVRIDRDEKDSNDYISLSDMSQKEIERLSDMLRKMPNPYPSWRVNIPPMANGSLELCPTSDGRVSPVREPKVGDKVRITDEVGTPWGGLKGIISNINYGAYRIKVTYPDEYIHTFFSINQFEIVEPVKERYYFSEDDKPEVGQMVYVDSKMIDKKYNTDSSSKSKENRGELKVIKTDGRYCWLKNCHSNYSFKYLYNYEPHDYAQGVLGRYPIKSMGSFGSSVVNMGY